VLDEVADEERTNPIELDPPLYEVIDPDALDALFCDGRFDGEVEFTYLGYRVHVAGLDRITVETV